MMTSHDTLHQQTSSLSEPPCDHRSSPTLELGEEPTDVRKGAVNVHLWFVPVFRGWPQRNMLHHWANNQETWHTHIRTRREGTTKRSSERRPRPSKSFSIPLHTWTQRGAAGTEEAVWYLMSKHLSLCLFLSFLFIPFKAAWTSRVEINQTTSTLL